MAWEPPAYTLFTLCFQNQKYQLAGTVGTSISLLAPLTGPLGTGLGTEKQMLYVWVFCELLD